MGPRVTDPRSSETLSAHIQVWPQVIDGFGKYDWGFEDVFRPRARRDRRHVKAAALALLFVAVAAAGEPHRSGFADMSPATPALQRDDMANPAWLWLKDGEQRFVRDCARCHAVERMDGVAARYPAWDATLMRPLTLGGRIGQCQQRHDGGPPLGPENDARLALETFVAHRSRAWPITPPADPRLASWRERGRVLYGQRVGQLDLACADCHDRHDRHDRHVGQRLSDSLIPQGHPNGYPIYRLEWQGTGSLQRRLRGCLAGVRAEPFAADNNEFTALELFLMQRATGMPVQTPAVRP